MTKFNKVLTGAILAVALFATTASAAYTQAGTLKLGSRNSNVMSLQQTLNMTSCKVAVSGAGSMGHETTYFGPATKAAVKCFQASMGLTADGVVGPMTGAKVAMISGGVTNLPAGCTSTSGYSPINGQACNGVVTTPGQTGSVTVSLSQDNPASGTIVNNQATADLLHLTFNGSGTVTSVSLKRSGLSSQNTFTNVYLYDGATRLSDGYSFNSTGDLTINGLNLAVNGSKTISVKADADANAAADSTVAIALTSFTANGTTNAVNIMGNTFALSTASNLATVTFSGSNSVSAATVNSGISGYALFRQSIQVNQRTVLLKAANFRVTGSAPTSSLANVKLVVDGVDTMKTATIMSMNGSNYISFDLMSSPFSLTTGSHTVEVRADVTGGSSYTVQVGLQQASDLMILDPQYGVNIAISSFSASNGGLITINPGSATIVQDPSFSTMTNVTGGASNVAIAKFKVHGYGEDVKVNTLTVTPVFGGTLAPTCTPGTNCTLDDVTLYFNGSQVGTQQDYTPGTGSLTFNLGSQLIIPANSDSTLEVRANIRSASGVNYTGGTIRADLVAGSNNAEGRTSHTTISTVGATGSTLTIQTGLLSVAANPAYVNQSVSPNMSGQKIGSFVLQNQSSSEAVRVTNLKVDLGGSSALTNLSGLRTSENSSYSIQPQASNNFSVDFTLAPGATRTIDIFADTSSTTSVTVISSLTVTGIGASSNVSLCVDGDNNCGNGGAGVTGQTITISSGAIATGTLLTSSSTQAQYIAAGTTTGVSNASKATFNFTATSGSATISELKFAVTGSGVASVTVNGQTAPVVSGTAYITGLNIAVPNGSGGTNVDAFVSYSPVGANGVASATTASIALSYTKYSSGGTTSTICASGCTTTVANVSAPTMTLVASKPTLTVDGSQKTGLVLGAENKIGEVTVSADAAGNISVGAIKFNVGGAGVSAGPAVTAPRIADGTTTISGSTCTPTTGGGVTTSINCVFSPEYTIQAGSSKTFSLFGTVNATVVAGATVSISTQVDQAGFTWTDVAGNGTASARTGTLIYNFPTQSYSLRQ